VLDNASGAEVELAACGVVVELVACGVAVELGVVEDVLADCPCELHPAKKPTSPSVANAPFETPTRNPQGRTLRKE
jgi:hypothetical protein